MPSICEKSTPVSWWRACGGRSAVRCPSALRGRRRAAATGDRGRRGRRRAAQGAPRWRDHTRPAAADRCRRVRDSAAAQRRVPHDSSRVRAATISASEARHDSRDAARAAADRAGRRRCRGGSAGRHAGDVADHQRQLHVHLDQGLLHPLNERARALDQRVRCRRYRASATMASAGRKLPRKSPRMWRSRSHSQSETSLLRLAHSSRGEH